MWPSVYENIRNFATKKSQRYASSDTFRGKMILSQEAAKSVGESNEERVAIEGVILPGRIIAGFSTVTITSMFITSLLVGLIG